MEEEETQMYCRYNQPVLPFDMRVRFEGEGAVFSSILS
jgi:hypothetical protein